MDSTETAGAQLRADMAAVAERHGPWHSHNVYLGHGVWTISDAQSTANSHLRRVVQLASDAVRGPLESLRVLDLACEEGLFSIELARRGAQVVGVEGRQENVARARFAADALGLGNVDFVHGDVRDVSREAFGAFDVVINVGILYHLDAPDVFDFMERIAAACDGVMVLSTHYARFPVFARRHAGRRYWGSVFSEHRPSDSGADRLANRRASLDNASSFWLTRPSLFNLMADVGFTSVAEVQIPRAAHGEAPPNMLTAVAFRGEPVNVPTSSHAPDPPAPRVPELGRRKAHPSQTVIGQLRDIARSRGLSDRLRRRMTTE